MKTVKIITSLILASMLALSASAAEYIPSAEAYEPEAVVSVDPATEKEYHASLVDSMKEVIEHIYNDTVEQVVATFVDSYVEKEVHEREFVSTGISLDGAEVEVKDEVKQTILEAEKELIENTLTEIVEEFEAKWEDTTGGAPVQNASIAKVFDISVPDSVKAKIDDGKANNNTIKVKFQFKIREVTHEDSFVLLHKPTGSGKWVVEEYTIDENDVITVELDEFSPFAVIIDKPVDPTPGQDSPQTGVEAYSVAAIVGAAVLCGVAYIVIRKASKSRTAA